MADTEFIITDSRDITRGSTGTTDVLDTLRRVYEISSIVSGSETYIPYVASTGLGDYELSVVESSGGTTTNFVIWHGTHVPSASAVYTVTFTVLAGFVFRGTDVIKKAFTSALRAGFSNQPFYTDFKYNVSELSTKLSIYPCFNYRSFKAPALIVRVGTGTAAPGSTNALDQIIEVRDSDSNLLGIRTLSPLSFSVVIDIFGNSNADECKLTDLTAYLLRGPVRWRLTNMGIGYTTVNISGEGTLEWQGSLLHTNTLTIQCVSESQTFYPIALVESINQINVTLTDEDTGAVLSEFTVPPPEET